MDVMRRLALSSFVLAIDSGTPMLRLMVGLLLSVFFLALLFIARPYKAEILDNLACSLQLMSVLIFIFAMCFCCPFATCGRPASQ